MRLFSRKRTWFAITVVMLAALGGAGCGFLLGRARTLRTANERLTRAAEQAGGPFVSLLDESNELLAQVNASKYPAARMPRSPI